MMDLRVIQCVCDLCDEEDCEHRPGNKVKSRNRAVSLVVVHRIGESLGTTPKEVIKSFRDTRPFAAGSYTGGTVPYTFWIDKAGRVFQFLSMDDLGWHSRRWSIPGVGVSVCGDFREHEPSDEQMDSLRQLCRLLCYWIGKGYQLAGHTELPEGSFDPKKECPGKHLDMDLLRADVRVAISHTKELDTIGRKLLLMNYGLEIGDAEPPDLIS